MKTTAAAPAVHSPVPIKTFPVLKLIGRLAPDPELQLRARKKTFSKGVFTNSANCHPEQLKSFLQEHGYASSDTGHGMLFASNHGVQMHTDDGYSVLWVLDTPAGGKGPQIVVGSEYETLYTGSVWLFNSRKPHGVIAMEAGLWSVYSCYVSRISAGKSKSKTV